MIQNVTFANTNNLAVMNPDHTRRAETLFIQHVILIKSVTTYYLSKMRSSERSTLFWDLLVKYFKTQF